MLTQRNVTYLRQHIHSVIMIFFFCHAATVESKVVKVVNSTPDDKDVIQSTVD